MQFRDNLEIPGGNTRRQTKVEVGLGYCSYRRQVLKLVREMGSKKNIWSEPQLQRINFTDTKGYYIKGGNTQHKIKVKVGLGYCSTEDKCLNLHEKRNLKENMVGTTIAKGQIPDIR